MSNDTLDFLSPVDRTRVALRQSRVTHKVLIVLGVVVTVALMVASVWLGA